MSMLYNMALGEAVQKQQQRVAGKAAMDDIEKLEEDYQSKKRDKDRSSLQMVMKGNEETGKAFQY
jgi:hypothetical protein